MKESNGQSNVCPFCLVNSADSNDHIFPEFLGGTRTVRACKSCNNAFGTQFEGPVSRDIGPVAVTLSLSGYQHCRRVVFERAFVDTNTGIECDLYSDKSAAPHDPVLMEEDGQKQIIAASYKHAKSMIPMLSPNKGVTTELRSIEIHQPTLRDITLSIGIEIRQLAIKMCIGLYELLGDGQEIAHESCRTCLFDKDAPPIVRLVHSSYSSLQDSVDPMSHVIYVEGDPDLHRSYGVVSLFGGALCFYVPLSDEYIGKEFAYLGVLNLATFSERFERISGLKLSEEPRVNTLDKVIAYHADWGTNLNKKIEQTFGRNTVLLGMSSKQQIQGINHRLPLLWIEHEVKTEIPVRLLADRVNEKPLSLENDPTKWEISDDYGETLLPVISKFVEDFNAGILDRDLDVTHSYHSDLLSPQSRFLLLPDYWCPLASMEIRYTIKKRAWLGTVDLSGRSGVLDLEQGSLDSDISLTHGDVPKVRDPSWPEVDPSDYRMDEGQRFEVQKWNISLGGSQLTSFDIH